MALYEIEPEQDPYCYPGSDVLRNKFNLTSDHELDTAERAETLIRQRDLRLRPIKGNFDMEHLKSIHQHLFKNVYEWAGDVRTTSIWKGGSMFDSPHQIESRSHEVFTALAKDNHLKGRNQGEFVDGLAFHFSRLNRLHPFREGNGRATQTFLCDLGKEAGYHLDFSKVDKTLWMVASRESNKGS
jgi:cell filamentation protein